MIGNLIGWITTASVKGAILILLVAALQWIGRDRIPSRWRYAMWLIVVLRLAIPVAPPSTFSLYNVIDLVMPASIVVEPIHIPAALPPPVPALMEAGAPAELLRTRLDLTRLAVAAGWIWLAGVGLLALRLAISSVRFHWWLGREAVGNRLSAESLALFEECRVQLGVGQSVAVIETDLVSTPALHGIARPTLLLPRGLTDTFSPDELRFVFLHELAHLRRLDVAANWAIAAVQITHWFNPLVWLAIARMREEREIACDEMALSWLQQEERTSYGRTILKLLDRFRAPAPVPALLGILENKNQLKRRLWMITHFRTRSSSSLLFLALLIALGAVALTDARAGERLRMLEPLDPAVHATMQKLDQKISLELTGTSLSEFLEALSNRTVVVITQSPEIASAPAQQKRITVKADKVPAHLVLLETLAALRLGFDPGATGITITNADSKDQILYFAAPRKGEPGTFEKKIERTLVLPEGEHEIAIETNGTPEEAMKVIRVLEGEAPAEEADERVFVRKIHPDAEEQSPDGTIRRNLKLRMIENDLESTGSLQIEIRDAN